MNLFFEPKSLFTPVRARVTTRYEFDVSKINTLETNITHSNYFVL